MTTAAPAAFRPRLPARFLGCLMENQLVFGVFSLRTTTIAASLASPSARRFVAGYSHRKKCVGPAGNMQSDGLMNWSARQPLPELFDFRTSGPTRSMLSGNEFSTGLSTILHSPYWLERSCVPLETERFPCTFFATELRWASRERKIKIAVSSGA